MILTLTGGGGATDRDRSVEQIEQEPRARTTGRPRPGRRGTRHDRIRDQPQFTPFRSRPGTSLVGTGRRESACAISALLWADTHASHHQWRQLTASRATMYLVPRVGVGLGHQRHRVLHQHLAQPPRRGGGKAGLIRAARRRPKPAAHTASARTGRRVVRDGHSRPAVRAPPGR